MAEGVFNAKEAFDRCEQIADRVKRDLVRHGLLFSLGMLTRKSPLDVPHFHLDLRLFEQLLEAIASDRQTLMALAQGAAAGESKASLIQELCNRSNRLGLVIQDAEALAYAAEIGDGAVRALVQHLLDHHVELDLGAPVDLLVHTWMLEGMFEPTHFIEATASGREPGTWM